MDESRSKISNRIEEMAVEEGFSGIAMGRVSRMNEEADRLEEWLSRGYHGKMTYMENHFEKRVDPSRLVPGAKSVVCLAYNYYSSDLPLDPTAPKISKYAYGVDYHLVLRKKLNRMLERLQEEFGNIQGRGFVDSAPVLERDWARRSGLGWVGKNTLLIHPKKGSYFFLAELILDIELDYGEPIPDYCGRCTRCIDACPTGAISEEGYVMDGSKCISYLTIELREDIPESFRQQMENWMYGCDICQDVCPWNRFSSEHDEPEFVASPELLAMTADDWSELSQERFQKLFRKSAIKRTKYAGLRRNIDFLKGGAL